MDNLAESLRELGDLTGARELHERALDAQRRRLGEDHPDTLLSMHNLALTLWAQRHLASARGLLERALEARRRVLGEDHPATLRSKRSLAAMLRRTGISPDPEN